MRKFIEKYIFMKYDTSKIYHFQTGLIVYNLQHKQFADYQKKCYESIIESGIQCQVMFFFISQMFSNDIIIPFNKSFYDLINII